MRGDGHLEPTRDGLKQLMDMSATGCVPHWLSEKILAGAAGDDI